MSIATLPLPSAIVIYYTATPQYSAPNCLARFDIILISQR